MDLLWNCSDIEQITQFINALPTKQDKIDARSLVLIATWEALEQELGFGKDAEHAADLAISRAMQ